ncbi:Fic family protein [Promicromonospora sp. NPDC023805]|uniref:Fic/DOC family protein n=1 Tax=Promicromonospora sp. NPDC023805 TaxID=3154696 RepID=UPI0033DC84A2
MNNAGHLNAEDLREFEEEFALLRVSQALGAEPVSGNLDRAHMCAIHQHIFGDVYAWAGQERTAPSFPERMTKNGPTPRDIRDGRYDAEATYPYAYYSAGEGMTEHFDRSIRTLHQISGLREMTGSEFASAIAEPWGEINVAHLFREGNTRTQVVFFTYFAHEHGHTVDSGRFSRDPDFRLKFNAGRFMVQETVDATLLAEALAEVIDVEPLVEGDDEIPGPTTDIPVYYQPHYVTSSGVCGAPTANGKQCRRRGRCPHHKGRISADNARRWS